MLDSEREFSIPNFANRGRLVRRIALALLAMSAVAGLLTGTAAAQSTWYVNNVSDIDDGLGSCPTTCSLRDAIEQANFDASSDTIEFEFGLVGFINLSSPLPEITQTMTILGPGAELMTISGGNFTGIISIGGNNQPNVYISGLTFADATGAIADAAAFSYLTIYNCTFTANSGSAISNLAAALTIYDSTFNGNSAGNGGAINSQDNAVLTVYFSTFTGNSATLGGAIYAQNSNRLGPGISTIYNSTITGNTASTGGGGVYNSTTLGGSMQVTGSIVAGNTTGGAPDSDDCDTCTTSGNNIIGGTPPTLGPLAWNGGPTQTMIPLPGSAAVGAGAYIGGYPDDDQRGFQRLSSNPLDLGAVQTHYLTVVSLADITSGSPDCSDPSPTECTLRDALNESNFDNQADIVFSSSLFPGSTPQTITLTSALPQIMSDGGVNIVGPGANLLTVSGNGTSQILNFNGGTLGNVSGITLSDGLATGIIAGGGIYNDGFLSTESSVISNNLATAGVSFGGGIANDSNGTMLIIGSTVSGNSAGGPNCCGGVAGGGGGIYSDGTLVLLDDTISGNTAVDKSSGGGGMFVDSAGTLLAENVTISGNIASDGGGVYGDGLLDLFDTTISGNTALNDDGGNGAGGLYVGITAGENFYEPILFTLENSIVAGNTNNGSQDCVNCDPSINTNSVDSVSLLSGNPDLGALALNGLDTQLQTMLPIPGSPVIGAGETSELPPGLVTDERGYPRTTAGALDLGAAQTDYTAIEFYTQPTNTTVNASITPAPQVEVLETDGNLSPPNNTDAVSGVPITLTYSDAPNMTGIPGTPPDTTPTVVNSLTIPLATFSGLVPTAVANGVYLTATSGPLTMNSSPFDVTGYSTSTVANNATASYSASDQIVQLSATVLNTSSQPGTPTGTVNFTVINSNSVTVGTASGSLNGSGAVTANFTLPGGSSAGTYTIDAVYGGSGDFTGSSDNTHTLTVNPDPQTINYFATLSSPVVFSFTPINLSATATSGLPVSFRVVSGPATVTNSTLTLTGAGTVVVGADQAGDTDYLPATEVTQTFQADPAGYVVTVRSDDPTTVNALNCPPGGPTPLPNPTTGLNCSLRDALAAATAYGGGNITFYSGTFNASNTTAENTITMTGSTMSIPSTTTITGPTAGAVQVNLVTVDGANQYAVFSVASGVTATAISNLTIQHGSTSTGGGAIQNQGALALMADTLYDNQSTGAGAGAVAGAAGSQLTAIDCTFYANTTAGAGGAIASLGSVSATNSTFYANTATVSAGGIAIGGAGTLVLANSIVTGNTGSASALDDVDSTSPVTNSGGNILGYLNGSAVNTTAIALAPLAHYGGPTQTLMPLPGSPAICGAVPALALNATGGALTTDQRGYPRTNSSYTGSACVDAGAVQTNYSIGFVEQPSNVVVSTTMAPAPTVQLYESGAAFGSSTSTIGLTLHGNGALSGGSAVTGAGSGLATYSGISVSQTGSGDTLTASLTLTPAGATPAIAVTSLSSPFNVTAPLVVLDFTVAVSGASVETVIPGTGASYTLVVAPTEVTYPGTVTLSVTGLPQGYTATFTPPSIPANGGPQTVIMTIQTPPAVVAGNGRRPAFPDSRLPVALSLLLLPLAGARRLRRQGRNLGRMFCLLAVLIGSLAGAAALSGCGAENGFFLTAPNSYPLTVTGTSGGLNHSVNVTLNVE